MNKQLIGKLMNAIKAIQAVTNDELMLHQLWLLLAIADAGKEPVSFTELSDRTMLSRAAISRNMALLGNKKKKVADQWIDTGYGLIEIMPYPYDTRAYAAVLSAKGRALMNQVEAILG